jgi:ketosteroid isomerase-like protein
MKILLALVLLIVPAFAADTNPKAEKEVTAAVEAWRQALLKGDGAALGKLYHADLVYEHSTAKNETKAEAIQAVTAPEGAYKALDLHDVSIRTYGNTALYKSKGEFTTHAGTVSHLDTLMVWVKTGQGWQLVSRQSTKLP